MACNHYTNRGGRGEVGGSGVGSSPGGRKVVGGTGGQKHQGEDDRGRSQGGGATEIPRGEPGRSPTVESIEGGARMEAGTHLSGMET